MNHFIEDKNPTFGGEPSDHRSRRHRDQLGAVSRAHMQFGWYALLFYLVLGAALEMLHGFKIDYYLNVTNETRRMLWTLAHAHGTLLALINIVFALTVPTMPQFGHAGRTLASRCLIGATILLPGGFFFGGMFIAGGDPGLPVLLVPLGALLLFIGVFIVARHAGSSDSSTATHPRDTDRDRNTKSKKQLTHT